MKWKDKLIKNINSELEQSEIWAELLERVLADPNIGIHLAIFNEPFLALIYKGEKEIESRFSINKISPFLKVSSGDLIILKSSGGPVTGFFIAGQVKYYSNLDTTKLNKIEIKYGRKICSNYDPNFWVDRKLAKYATLIEVKKVFALNPFKIEKKDRLGWSIIKKKQSDFLFKDIK